MSSARVEVEVGGVYGASEVAVEGPGVVVALESVEVVAVVGLAVLVAGEVGFVDGALDGGLVELVPPEVGGLFDDEGGGGFVDEGGLVEEGGLLEDVDEFGGGFVDVVGGGTLEEELGRFEVAVV